MGLSHTVGNVSRETFRTCGRGGEEMAHPQVLVSGDYLLVLLRAIRSRTYELEEMDRSLGFNYNEELKALKDLDELFTNEIKLWRDK